MDQDRKNKNLVIVDVQKEYSKLNSKFLIDENYVYDILDVIKKEKIDKIYYIVDYNSGTIHVPIQLHSVTDAFYYKNYAGIEISELDGMVERNELTIIENEIAYMDTYGGYIITTDNAHELQYVDTDLKSLIDLIKEDDNILIGGCDGECLQDIEKVFEFFNVPYKRNNSLIYPIYVPKNPYVDTIEWLEMKCPF